MAGNPEDNAGEAAQSGLVMGFAAHRDRARAIGEVHARPHPPVATPRTIVQLAFVTESPDVDQAVLAEFASRQGVAAPDAEARHFTLGWGKGTLRWERHTEFSTWLWEGPLETRAVAPSQTPFGNGFSPPGAVISGVRLEIRKWTKAAENLLDGFDPASLCYSLVENGRAAAITDFRQDGDGLTRILVLDKGLTPARVGALSQRLVEIETYRTLAMFGLPLAQTLSPRIRRIEDRLAGLTGEMRDAGRRGSEELLADLTALAAELEADAAASLYRFGASRAYHGIVEERLAALQEVQVPGFDTWSAFLQRRVAPAMRTCRSIEERQANMSEKLARTATLLRTWVDVDVERQNRDVLASMNRRAKLQLRLQQTVEGLSVAAVSYYIVGLVAYLAKGAEGTGMPLKAETAAALSVPFAILAVWWVVRRIRGRHRDDPEADAN